MTDKDPIKVSYSTLADLKGQMSNLSNAFTNTVPAVQGTESEMGTGAGEFAQYLSYGAAEFELAWTAGLTAMAQGSALIGNNIGQAALDFNAVDVQQSSEYVL